MISSTLAREKRYATTFLLTVLDSDK